MSEQKKTLGLILIIVTYVVVAIIGFFIVYFIRMHLGYQPSKETAAVKHVLPTPIPGKLKTYKDDSANFALNYPADLSMKQASYGFGVSAIELRSPDNMDKSYAPNIQMLTVPSGLAKTVGQDFDSYYAMPNKTTKVISSPLGKDKTAEAFTKIRNRDVNGLRAVDYTSVPSPNPEKEDPEIGTFIQAGDTLIILSTGETDREALEQMLKTFTYPL